MKSFLGEDKQEKGLFYTPSHLTKLLIDECIPLKKYKELNLKNFKVLDPACGSGIFLVVAFKRLVQIWRLQNEMKFPDITDLKLVMVGRNSGHFLCLCFKNLTWISSCKYD